MASMLTSSEPWFAERKGNLSLFCLQVLEQQVSEEVKIYIATQKLSIAENLLGIRVNN